MLDTERGSRPAAVTWLVTLSLIGLSVLPAHAGYERNCDHSHGSPQGFCGPILSELLSMLCKAYNKRSAEPARGAMAPQSLEHKVKGSSLDPGVFLPRHEAVSLLQKRSYGVGRITCECCIHKCEVQELKQYCAEPDNDMNKRSWSRLAEALIRKHPNGDDGMDGDEHAKWRQEMKDIADKHNVGQELLRLGPGYWDHVADTGHRNQQPSPEQASHDNHEGTGSEQQSTPPSENHTHEDDEEVLRQFLHHN